MLTPEQILAAHKANLETVFGLTAKAFAGVEKLVELNVTAAKAALADASETTQAALSVKDAQQLMALQAGLMQPLAEKAASYSRHLYDIASGTGAEFGKAFEAQAADGQKKFASLVDSAAANAPAGSEAAVAVMKNAVSAANKPPKRLKATSTLWLLPLWLLPKLPLLLLPPKSVNQCPIPPLGECSKRPALY